MKLLQHFISVILVFTYLWGLGHSFIPHCQEDCLAFHQDADIHHHEHKSDQEAHASGNEKHIHHDDHVDNNLIELYLCLLSEYEHHGGSSHPPKTDEDNEIRSFNFDFSYDQKIIPHKLLAIFSVAEFQASNLKLDNKFFTSPGIRYTYLFSQCISFRGPPVYSC